MFPPNVVLEDEPNYRPRDVVHRTRRRNSSRTTEDDREANTFRKSVQGEIGQRKRDVLDIANKAIRPPEVDQVCNRWANRSNEEKVCEHYPRPCQPPLARYKNRPHTAVDLARREHSHRTDDAPNNARSTKHLRARADESILLRRTAHVRNIREHPGLYPKLDRPGDYRSDDLALMRVSNPILNLEEDG